MKRIVDLASRLCVVGAMVLGVVAVLTAGGRDAAAALILASDCDNTCVNGKVGDANPCVTSATGSCKVSATAPKGTDCSGCNFAPLKDDTGKVIGCTSSCSSVTST